MNFYTSEAIQVALARLKQQANNEPYPLLKTRQMNLSRLQDALLKHEHPLLESLQKDFGHQAHAESRMIELIPVLGEFKYARRNLHKWLQPSKRHLHIGTLPASAKVHYQPKFTLI